MNQLVRAGRILYRLTKTAIWCTVFLSALPILLPAFSIAWCIGFALLFQVICGALGLALLRKLLSMYFTCRSGTSQTPLTSRVQAFILPIHPDLELLAAASLDDALVLLREASCSRSFLSDTHSQVGGNSPIYNFQSPSTPCRQVEFESLRSDQPGIQSSSSEPNRSGYERRYADVNPIRIFEEEEDLEFGKSGSGGDAIDLSAAKSSSGDVDGNSGELVVSVAADPVGVTRGGSCRQGNGQRGSDSVDLSGSSRVQEINLPIRERDALECMKVVEFCLSQAEEFSFEETSSCEDYNEPEEDDLEYMQEVISLRFTSASEDCSSSSKSGRPEKPQDESSYRLTSSIVESLSDKINTRLKRLEMETEVDSGETGKLSVSFSDESFSGSSGRDSDESSTPPRVSFSSRLGSDELEVTPSMNSNSLGMSSVENELKFGSGESSTGNSRTRLRFKGVVSPDVEEGGSVLQSLSPSLNVERSKGRRSRRRMFPGFSEEEMKVLRKLPYSKELLSCTSGSCSSNVSSSEQEIAALNKFQQLLRFWREKERGLQVERLNPRK